MQDKEETYKKDKTRKRHTRRIGQGRDIQEGQEKEETYKKDRTRKRNSRRIGQGREIQGQERRKGRG